MSANAPDNTPMTSPSVSLWQVDARNSGVFDTLVVLHERIAFNEGRYSERSVEMAFEPHGYTLFQDYIARRAGDPWRDANGPQHLNR